jgi:indole-3-glycerol phosphate synthase
MNILENIVRKKREEVENNKLLYPTALLEKSIYFETVPVSLKAYLQKEGKSGIIAEIKRKSPSKGMINKYISVERTSIGYMQAGASALSVLTDKEFFGGSNEDLLTARKYNYCPILRKDFIVDEYQIIEAKSIGADVVLLIAAALSKEAILRLAAFARSLKMEVLLEVHNEQDLRSGLNEYIDLIGVNNRNLEDFSVDINVSRNLVSQIPSNMIKISESGIDAPETIRELKAHGYSGFLMGEAFMRSSRPERACAEFISKL